MCLELVNLIVKVIDLLLAFLPAAVERPFELISEFSLPMSPLNGNKVCVPTTFHIFNDMSTECHTVLAFALSMKREMSFWLNTPLARQFLKDGVKINIHRSFWRI